MELRFDHEGKPFYWVPKPGDTDMTIVEEITEIDANIESMTEQASPPITERVRDQVREWSIDDWIDGFRMGDKNPNQGEALQLTTALREARGLLQSGGPILLSDRAGLLNYGNNVKILLVKWRGERRGH